MINQCSEIPQLKNKERFLISRHKKFIINPSVQKIMGFCPMFDNTAVYIAVKSYGQESVTHINEHGKILKQLIFTNTKFLYNYAFPSDREVIWLDCENSFIMQWNLQTNELVKYSFPFLWQSTDCKQIFYFPETKLLCVCQRGRYDSNAFRLTYFRYPLNKNSENLIQFQSQHVWNHEYSVSKANQRSMMLWFRSTQQEILQFRIFELQEDSQGHCTKVYKQHRIQNPIKLLNKHIQICINQIWEMFPQKYMMCLIPLVKQRDQLNSLYVYEQKKGLLRQSKIWLKKQYRFQQIEIRHFGNTTMIKTMGFEGQKIVNTPIYYIDHSQQQIAVISHWKCSLMNKYTLPGYDQNLIIDSLYDNGDVKQIECQCIKIVESKLMTTHFLDRYIPSIDYALLEDVLRLIYAFKQVDYAIN